MKGRHRSLFFLLVLIFVLLVAGCSFFGSGSSEYPKKSLTVDEPGGAELSIDPGALNKKTDITIEDVGEGEPLGGASPFTPASSEYVVDLGEADQIGAITMTVPLGTSAKQSAPSSGDRVFVTWAEPVGGTPSVVGTIVENNQATFPLVGSGKYQIYSILSHEALMKLVSIFDPLAVPTYRQETSNWCSPTAMTNLAQFHEGIWPAGGLGSSWGSSSNYYLAGKASQPPDKGYFFHWLLGAGGYSVPEDVKQSFSNSDFEVIIWNWKALVDSGYSNPIYAEALFNYFQAYVESYVWGVHSPRRPVAWGSSLASHSRTITGSNGSLMYYNDPSSGSLNQTRNWDVYKNSIITSLTAEKIEVIDTVVFHAPPRPASERTGVIWLRPSGSVFSAGSVALKSGETDAALTNWRWDGSGGHSYGYYYEDVSGMLEPDPVYGSQWEAFHYKDYLDVQFDVKNISDTFHDYTVEVYISNEAGTLDEMFYTSGPWQINTGIHENFGSVGYPFRIANKPPGIYRITFALKQGGVIVDTKFVQFRLHEQDKIFLNPYGFVNKQAYCRKGPDPVFDGVMIYEEGTELNLLGVNPQRTWGLFEKEINGKLIQCWMAYGVVDLTNEEHAQVMVVPDMPVKENPTKDKPEFSCSNIKNESDCIGDSRCTWKFTIAAPAYCTEK